MAQTGSLQVDQLFKGLTRPPMIFGVTTTYFGMNLIGCLLAYIITEQMKILFTVVPTFHAIGYIICFKEPLFMELFMMYTQKCSKCRNKMYHGANSYDVL